MSFLYRYAAFPSGDALAGTTFVALALSLVVGTSQVRAEMEYHARRAIAGPNCRIFASQSTRFGLSPVA